MEQLLVDHVIRGEWLDLAADGEVIVKAAMQSWGDSRTCRATVIRDILLGRLAPDPDPHGLRLRGARITGRLDLQDLATDVHLELKDCLLEQGVLARRARLAGLVLAGCQIEHPAESPLDGARLTCGVLALAGASVSGHAGGGAVDLTGARIGGSLDCDGAQLRNDSGPALSADGLQLDQDMLLTGEFVATGSGEDGGVRLVGARIGGQLHCTWAELNNESGPALRADGLHVDQGMFLGDVFVATGSGEDGAVDLTGARIGGQLRCTKVELRNDSGPALVADRLQVCQDMYLTNGFWATGDSAAAAVSLAGARIGGVFNCAGADLRNDSGPALMADGLQVDRDMFLHAAMRSAVGTGRMGAVGFSATGFGGYGAVRLVSARIGGQLDFTDAKLHCTEGRALVANDLRVGEDVLLNRQFTATGGISMYRAQIGGAFECDQANLRASGSALVADSLQVGQDMSLTGGFSATGGYGGGAVRLAGAHIGGNLYCTGAELRNGNGPALVANGIQVGRDMYITDGFTALVGGEHVAVDLTGARVGGVFRFAPERVEHESDSHRRLAVDGLTYPGVPETQPPWDWREVLRDETPGYAAQPYQQLAAGYRALGDDRHARRTLIAQRDDQLARTHPHWAEKWWGKITKVTLGYGYQPWRALVFLAAVVVLSCVLAVALGSHGALAQTSQTATPGKPCTVVQKVGVGLDLNLPVGTTVSRAACDLAKDPASATAAWLTAAGWVLRVLAWVFAALFIAGFTSAVRKT
jgi:hypothetical protein